MLLTCKAMILRTLLLFLLAAPCAAAQPVPDTLHAPADSLVVFGWSVDADEDRLLVGAWERRSLTAQRSISSSDPTGTAFVYRRDGDDWTVEARLRADEIGNEDCFSWSIDLRDDLAAVGAPCERAVLPDGRVYRGAVYLFRRAGAEWVREAKILSADVPEPWVPQGYFGRSVSLGDGFLVTGTTYAENPANPDDDWDSGAAYVFALSDGAWQYEATLVNSDTDTVLRERFGISLAVVGVNVLIGATGEGPDINRRGAVYVFRRAGDRSWIEQDKLFAYDRTAGAEFGLTVAAGGGEVVVASSNAVYPLERWEGLWRVEPSVAGDLGPVALSVARYGDRIVALDPIFFQTQAMLFSKEAGEWNGTDLPLTPIEQWLPEMASMTATHAFIGHPNNLLDPGGESESYVLVYDLGPATSSEPSLPGGAALALTIAPNPMRRDGTIRIDLPNAGSARLTVYDMLGREVMQLTEEARTAGGQVVALDASGLAPGVYVLRLQTERQAVTRRFTVVR